MLQLSLLPCRNQLLTSSNDGTSRVWNLKESLDNAKAKAPPLSVSISSQVLSDCRPKSETKAGRPKVLFVNYSPNQRHSLSATDRNEAWMHDLAYGENMKAILSAS